MIKKATTHLSPSDHSESDGSYEVVAFNPLKVVAPYVVIFLILIVGFWVLLLGDSVGPTGKDYGDSFLVLQAANKRLLEDHLTWPKGDSAFDLYRSILDEYPDFISAQEGIRNVGQRYIVLIEGLIAENRFDLARETLQSASHLSRDLSGEPFSEKLAVLSKSLTALELSFKEDSEKVANKAIVKFKALGVFRDLLKDGGQSPDMVFIPTGSFLFGSSAQEFGRDSDEGPQMSVEIQRFAVSATELSFSDFKRFTDAVGLELPSDEGWGYEQRPVINVTWLQAKAYINWISKQSGYRYRLLTEAEWEYVARAGRVSSFAQGDCLTEKDANFDDSFVSIGECVSSGVYLAQTVDVSTYGPSPWGLYQVHGNVREWVEDCWMPEYSEASKYGKARYFSEAGSCGALGKRVLRGGAWNGSLKSARFANRFAVEEGVGGSSFGFRLARDVD